MIRHFIFIEARCARGFTPSIGVLTATVSDAPTKSFLVAPVGRAALLTACRSAATVTTIDLSAITGCAANEHRATVRSATKAQKQKGLWAGLHRSRGGTRQPKPFAGKIKPSW